MKHHPVNEARSVRRGVRSALLASAGLLSLGAAGPAAAFDFSNESGTLTGSWDTTLSYGQAWRTQSPDRRLIATANGGLTPFPGSGGMSRSPNIDDGNLNYLAGDSWSQAFKVTTELSVKYGDFGAFTRFSALYDYAVMDQGTNRTPISGDAEGLVGKYGRLLDAFVYGNFQLGENHPLELRIGKQIVSWGESTFIQGGLTAVNTVDVAALRVPGAELKEGFMPQQMVRATLGLSENTSVEGFYMFDWKRTEPEPVGSYFSTNDFVPRGGTRVILGFGGFSDAGVDYRPLGGPFITDFQNVPRDATRDPKESGQFGLAFRWFLPNLGSGTELGFYFMNYHSRLPLLSGRAVTGPSANTGRFFVEYPEDIQLYGLSWNTNLPLGIAFQGEVSYRPNAPFQLDDVELLFAALTPLNTFIAAQGAPPAYQFRSQLGSAALGQEIRGWREHAQTQVQMTFTKVFGQVLGADQIATVAEVGWTQVDLPSTSVLRYEGEGTDTGGGCDVASLVAAPIGSVASPAFFGCARNPQTLRGGFPTDFSWGYRLAVRADYNSFLGTAFTFSPRVAFNHDVDGISPGPGGNFLEGRKSLTLGAEFNYLNSWVFDLAWTKFSGGEPFNQIADRDFASASVRYSF